MRSAIWLFVLRCAALAALLVSAALYVDYTSASPAYCAADSGCAAVRQSGYGYLPLFDQYIAVPLLGLVAFAALLGASLLWARRPRWLLGPALLGGVIGVCLLLVQIVEVHRLCALCVIVDGSAVTAGIAAFGFVAASRTPAAASDFAVRPAGWLLLAGMAVAAPTLWPKVRPLAPLAEGVRRLYQPGKINVVEFADYECPFCRRLAPRLAALIANYPGKVNFQRLNFPLPGHPHALGAARAQVCAAEQGFGDKMADALFGAEDLTPPANRETARALGVEMSAFDRCMASQRPDAQIERQSKILTDAGLLGLPTTFVGARTIVGAQPDEVFRDAFERALRGEGEGGIPAPAYLVGALALAAFVAWTLRVPRATVSHAGS